MTDRANQVGLAAVGDVVLLRPASGELFRAGWDDVDIRIANLEAPLTGSGLPAAKLIRLKSPVEAGRWLTEIGCDRVSLANNHIMDWGMEGLRSTLETLGRAGIGHAGAGMTAEEAERPAVQEVRGWRIAFLSWACTIPNGFLARADRPGLAGVRVRTAYAADALIIDEQPGTPPWVHTAALEEDVAKLAMRTRTAREAADLVVLSLHWGVPPQWQSPFQGPLAEYQEALGRELVAAGVDLVLGHHAHTVYGVEAVERADDSTGLIVYSLGNYIFHPLGERPALVLDSPNVPYQPHERPENAETYVAKFTLRPDRGRLRVAEACLYPAHLNERSEARAPTREEARRIVERVSGFCAWRRTDVATEDGVVVWRAG